jgi:hypothetical protein
VVGEPCDAQEPERRFGGEQPLQPVEFEEYTEDGSVKVTRLVADNLVTEVTPAKQEPVAAAEPGKERAPARRGVDGS